MMRREARTFAAGLVVAASVAVGGACAAHRTANGSNDIVVQVQNDLVPPAPLTIFLVPDGGIRRLLGTVQGSGTVTIRNPPIGRYRLLARTDVGREIISDPVIAVLGDALKWDLYTNVISAARGNASQP